jgi:hypothetical protein
MDNPSVSDFRYPFPDPNAPPPDPDLRRLVAQLGSSAHTLRFALTSSVRPLDDEAVRTLAHGVLVGVEAPQSVVPVALTDRIEEARALLTEASRELDAP